jgi:8-oxo-dGTP diphosphatase
MSDSSGLEEYDPHAYPPFAVTVDIVVFTIRDDRLQLLLIQRGGPPFETSWALPGGFVHADEDLEAAARRELVEETGVESRPTHLAQLGAYGRPDRDPRMRVVTIAWWAIMRDLPKLSAGTDAVHADLLGIDDVLDHHVELAFDHQRIVADALEALRAEIERTSVATSFLDEQFRISDLRRVYETVWGVTLEPGNFQRKVRSIEDFVEPTGHRSSDRGGRPAELFSSPAAYAPLAAAFQRPYPEDDDEDAGDVEDADF